MNQSDQKPLTFDGGATNLIRKIANTEIATLGKKDVDQIKKIVSEYDPRTLSKSPIINEDGEPVPIAFPNPEDIQIRTLRGEEIPSDLLETIMQQTRDWVENYPQKLAEQRGELEVRPVRTDDVESYEQAMIGGEGVFNAKNDIIKRGTVLDQFGGMIFYDKPEEGEKLRDIVGNYHQKCRMADSNNSYELPADGNLFETLIEPSYKLIDIIGHSLSKKFNTRFAKEYSEAKMKKRILWNIESEFTESVLRNIPGTNPNHSSYYGAEKTEDPETFTVISPLDDNFSIPISKSRDQEIYKAIDDEFVNDDKFPKHDPVKNNARGYYVTVQAPLEKVAPSKSKSDSSQKTIELELLYLYANRDIYANEQICYAYGNKELFRQQEASRFRVDDMQKQQMQPAGASLPDPLQDEIEQNPTQPSVQTPQDSLAVAAPVTNPASPHIQVAVNQANQTRKARAFNLLKKAFCRRSGDRSVSRTRGR